MEEELEAKQPKPSSGKTTEEEYAAGVRLGATAAAGGGGDTGVADARERISVPLDVLRCTLMALNEGSAAGCSVVGYRTLNEGGQV